MIPGKAQGYNPSLFPRESSFGLDNVGYFTSSQQAPQGFQDSYSTQLVGRLDEHVQGRWFEGGAQADLRLMIQGISRDGAWASTYFEAPELYAGTSSELSPVRLTLGRKLESWSKLDDEWRLGIWQPRFRWDYLHPEIVGLTGAYLRIEQPQWKIVAWASPVFIPERGVNMRADGGVLASSSRWFVPPPSSVKVFNEETPVQYSVQMPEMRRLLAQPGGSIMARLGGAQGPWGSVGYAYKPMNQLLLADSRVLQLGATVEDIHGQTPLHPRVLYHALTSAEAGYEGDTVDAWFSVLHERPFRDATPSLWTTQEVQNSLAMNSNFDLRVAGSPERATRLDLSWLQQWGGNAGDRGPYALGGGASQFEARYPFQTALAMGFRSQAIARLSARTRLMYDLGHRGAVWSTELSYQPRRSWMVGVGADLLTSLQHESIQGANLIGRFNANDRVHAGVTYVF